MRDAKVFRSRGKFAAIFNNGVSPVVEMKNLERSKPVIPEKTEEPK